MLQSQGAPLLQTELTTSLAPFAEIRRRRTAAFGPFPDAQDFEREIGEVARSANSPKDCSARAYCTFRGFMETIFAKLNS